MITELGESLLLRVDELFAMTHAELMVEAQHARLIVNVHKTTTDNLRRELIKFALKAFAC